MSDDSNEENKEDAKSGDENKEISPPPINLPIPDEFDESLTDTAVRRTDAKAHKKAEKERRKKGGRKHPTDTYSPLKKSGGRGCCGCVALLLIVGILSLVGGGAYFAWWAIKPYADAGYEVVQDTKNPISVSEAPEMETIYIGNQIDYSPLRTPKKIVFVGSEVTISGTFEDKVTFKGAKLTILEGTLFKGDLEIYAAELADEGSTLEGDLTGKVIKQ